MNIHERTMTPGRGYKNKTATLDISVFGMGYVGVVSAACLTHNGHTVIGVDTNETKTGLVNAGTSPIIEKDVAAFLSEAHADEMLSATTDAAEAVANSNLSLVCVGTPSRKNGSLDTSIVEKVCEEIGAAIKLKDDYHCVVIRSTMLPGTIKEVVIPALEETSGKKAGHDFGLAINPEFLREGTAVYDFYNPPKTVIGSLSERDADLVAALYEDLDAPLFKVSIEVAEMTKYVDNVWHALKVAYGNEIGNICKPLGIDSHAVMEIFCQDTKLNIAPTYLKPGFAFGGSCLPKDLRALNYKAQDLDLSVPLIRSISESNRTQVERGLEIIAGHGRKNIAFFGISFKSGTDDLRESPQVELVERLLGKGYKVKIYDRNVEMARLTGGNKDYILKVIPHISDLIGESFEDVLAHGDVIVIGNSDPEFHTIPRSMNNEQILVDLVRIPERDLIGERYDGVNW